MNIGDPEPVEPETASVCVEPAQVEIRTKFDPFGEPILRVLYVRVEDGWRAVRATPTTDVPDLCVTHWSVSGQLQ